MYICGLQVIRSIRIKLNYHEKQMKDIAKIFNSKFQTQAVWSISERLTDSLYYAVIVNIISLSHEIP